MRDAGERVLAIDESRELTLRHVGRFGFGERGVRAINETGNSEAMFNLLDALSAAQAENARLREVVRRLADGEWIIASWLNEAGDFVWRVNVRDEPSKSKKSQTYSGTTFVGATPVAAGLAALSGQEKS